MEVIYPNQYFYEEEIHGLPFLETVKRVVRRSINEFKEQREHRALAEEYDFLVAKTLSLIKREFGDDVMVLLYEEHDIVAEIALREYTHSEDGVNDIQDRIHKVNELLWDAHAHWMRARGIRRGCWGCDEVDTVPGRKRCEKGSIDCGKYVNDDGEFPSVHIRTHFAPMNEAVEYYNGRYKGAA
jgi:hypothetical protein